MERVGCNYPYIWAHDQWWIGVQLIQYGKDEIYLALPCEGYLPCPLQLIKKEDWIDDVRD
jgi:hypothetical protein